MEKVYCLANRYFDLRVSDSALCSIRSPRDVQNTEFVLPGHSFAQVTLRYRKGKGAACSFAPEGAREESVERKNRNCIFRSRAQDSALTVTTEFSLNGKKLLQTVRVENRAKEEVELLDAGLSLPCNAKFEWGAPVGGQSIGHHFVGGNGSHSVLKRVDGEGPYLLFFPQDGTALTFFDVLGEDGANGREECLTVYALAKGRASLPENRGSRRIRMPQGSRLLKPGETAAFSFAYAWARDNDGARDCVVENGLVDVDVVPGLTVARASEVQLSLRSRSVLHVLVQYPQKTDVVPVRQEGDRSVYRLTFRKLGENTVTVTWGDGCFMPVEFFVTEPVEVLLRKRGAFIADHQIREPSCWYHGLFAEWNNETQVQLTPDNYDRIRGWRIYEVTCDDPGLAKPAFLSSKNAEMPVQTEVESLDLYLEKFVWGGLQRTDREAYPFGIYGIPDWHQNRFSPDPGIGGRLHLWRIYDYPHIAMLYYNMYRIANDYRNIHTALPAKIYLERAYGTALAMFLVPEELEGWSACKTGLYNEWVIPEIIRALQDGGQTEKAERLRRYWERKVRYFALECTDVFGSEYPFDTTGFQSTQLLAKEAERAAETTVREDRWNPPLLLGAVKRFLERQADCNIACRGWLEPAYFWYGSDYRGMNYRYTLSYMSQMGGAALLDYALYDADDPFPLLRLAYGSLQSSWALLNSGDSESGWGYWFPGKENDGAACGGFEPLSSGKTWLDQPHRGGAWTYSCEIDLGFCGALHGACTILAQDPVFGDVVYGGALLENQRDHWRVQSLDGVSRRFHFVGRTGRLHVLLERGRFYGEFRLDHDLHAVSFSVDGRSLTAGGVRMKTNADGPSVFRVVADGSVLQPDFANEVVLPASGKILNVELQRVSPNAMQQ